MTNNFDIFRKYIINEGIPYLEKDMGDLFFVIMLIRRGKDHPNLPAANYTFKNYYIDSIEKYDKVKDEIIKCCEMFGLRAYVSINIKSKEKFSKMCSLKLAQNILDNEYKKPWRIIDHIFGILPSKNKNKWIMDLDDCDENSNYFKEVVRIMRNCDSKFDDNYIMCIPTKSGVHIIAHPFNIKQFKDLCDYNGIEPPKIKENHITLLYENI